mmetsp:Transcript_5863/g.12754  ORF Transcript_5863/g.12754 Transcript_5863/m.12754 type:complete len:219 (+) Transcript_5863:773-1429(+)
MQNHDCVALGLPTLNPLLQRWGPLNHMLFPIPHVADSHCLSAGQRQAALYTTAPAVLVVQGRSYRRQTHNVRGLPKQTPAERVLARRFRRSNGPPEEGLRCRTISIATRHSAHWGDDLPRLPMIRPRPVQPRNPKSSGNNRHLPSLGLSHGNRAGLVQHYSVQPGASFKRSGALHQAPPPGSDTSCYHHGHGSSEPHCARTRHHQHCHAELHGEQQAE